jgi:hypothetical protein
MASRLSPVASPTAFTWWTTPPTRNPQFQQAIIAAVQGVTHIAPADTRNEIIGSPVVAHGVIHYALKAMGLCASVTGARYTTTTEVYPDSPRATPEQCIEAQVALQQIRVHGMQQVVALQAFVQPTGLSTMASAAAGPWCMDTATARLSSTTGDGCHAHKLWAYSAAMCGQSVSSSTWVRSARGRRQWRPAGV